LATNKITTVVDIDVKKAISALKDVEANLDGTETAGQKAAKALSAMAGVIDAEAKKAEAAIEAMSAALGSEFVGDLERAGGSVDQLVSELRRAGLAYEDVSASADELATSIKQVDAAGRRGAAGLDEVARSGDQSRSVLANLVGNSAQDLGELGGVAGTAGVALGQLAEYAVDGNIGLSNLAKVAGPMAAVAVAGFGISKAFEASAKRAEEAARKASVLKDAILALNEGNTTEAATTLVEEYSSTLDILERLGFTSQDLQFTLEGQGYVIRSLEQDYASLLSRIDELRELQSNGRATGAEIQELEALESAFADVSAVLDTLRNDQGVWEEQSTAVAEAKRRVDEYNASLRATATWWGDIAAQSEQARSVANDLADQDKAATSAANKIRALQQQLDSYIETVKDVPGEAVTEIQAALDSGNIALAERLLANLTRPRISPVYITTQFAGSGFGAKPPALGKGPNAGAGMGKGPTYNYNPGNILSGVVDDIAAGAASGGGGGGGGGSVEPEDPMAEWDAAIAKAFEYQELSLAEYRDYLTGRLAAYDRYSQEYYQIWQQIQKLNEDERRAAEQAAKEEEDRQRELKKLAEERAKREQELNAIREGARQGVKEGFSGMSSVTNIITNNPDTWLDQIRAWERNNGPSWQAGTGS
jgi:hypothetical protein